MGIPFRFTHHDQNTDPVTQNVPTKVTLKRTGHGIRLINNDQMNPLKISFDGGQHFYPVLAGSEFAQDDITFHYFFLLTAAAVPDWQALVKEG